MPNLTTTQAAAEIVALINARPHSPRHDEVEAIIAKLPVAEASCSAPALRAEWDALIAEHKNACSTMRTIPEGAPGFAALEKAAALIDNRLDECAGRICQAPEPGPAYIRLLAEVCFFVMWTCPWDDPTAEMELAQGSPYSVEGICADALAALLKAAWGLSSVEVSNA